ncbi:MAG: aldehyde dehydrogenase (NADP(+)) [Desulfobacteraceae bacterium]|nr:aldehyde dehydrogenase (NADP(+)) [Desulfobacteraceae bacterium]
MNLSGTHIIGFEEIKNSSTFTVRNPATGVVLEGEFSNGGAEDVERAAQLAERDFDAYRNMPLNKRADFLETIAEEILALGEALLERTMAETGLPQARLQGERGRTTGQLKLFAQVVREGSFIDARIDTAIPDRQPLPKPDVRLMQISLGPTAVFGASNFPLAFSVAGGDTASALAAGCPVIVKGHPAHPGASELVGRAIQSAAKKCNMPEGVFSLVQGNSIEVGQALVKHPFIKAVAFTGSFRGGKALFDLAAARPEPIPVYAEMGSTNPVFILPSALKKESVASGLVDSLTLGVGQFCTNPGIVFGLQGETFDKFSNVAADFLKQKPVGTMLHAGIKSAYEAGLDALTGVTGVEVIAGDLKTDGACLGNPVLLKTNAQTFLKNARLEEEVFGPSSLLIACESKEQILEIAKSLTGHLTATIHGTKEELVEYQELITILERKVGRIIFNGFPTGVEVCHSMNHGGPFPATTDSRTTSVGTAAIKRFLRPVCYQNFPQEALPKALKNENDAKIWRLVDGNIGQASV